MTMRTRTPYGVSNVTGVQALRISVISAKQRVASALKPKKVAPVYVFAAYQPMTSRKGEKVSGENGIRGIRISRARFAGTKLLNASRARFAGTKLLNAILGEPTKDGSTAAVEQLTARAEHKKAQARYLEHNPIVGKPLKIVSLLVTLYVLKVFAGPVAHMLEDIAKPFKPWVQGITQNYQSHNPPMSPPMVPVEPGEVNKVVR